MAISETTADAVAAGSEAAGAPVSTLPYRDGYVGLAGLCLAWGLAMLLDLGPLTATWLVLLATAAPMLLLELRRAPRPTGRRPWRFAPLAWTLGFAAATAPFILLHGRGGLDGWINAWVVCVPALILRFAIEAARNGSLSGGFPVALGRALLPYDRDRLLALAAPARVWTLKAIFIPIYGASLFALLYFAKQTDLTTPVGWLILAVYFAYTIDLAFGLIGYLFASSDLAPTLFTTQRLVSGWVVCLLCYTPFHFFWPVFTEVVTHEISWPALIPFNALGIAAGVAMLALLALYVSATVHFGLRFSNLSNRGIVTAGPYRWMKHPAYFAHAANSWIIVLVILPLAGVDLGPTQWLVPPAFTVLYTLRSLTEEKHLGEDPAYRAYADWISRHGLLARMLRVVRR